MGSVNNNVPFGNSVQFGDSKIFDTLEKGGASANAELQKQLGSYSEKQIQNLSSIKADDFRQIVNYVNPKNKGAACFTDELTLTKCNNKIDVGSWRIGLNAKKNMLMRQTFANALAPGLKYVADNDKLSTLLSVVTGKQVRIAGRKAGGEIMLDTKGGVFSTNHLERKDIREAFKVYDESFNTTEGRRSVLKTMLMKLAEDNGVGKKMKEIFNQHVGNNKGAAFIEILSEKLNEEFGFPKDKVQNLLKDMLTVKNLDTSEVKEGDGYVDRSDAMKLSANAFIAKLNELEQSVDQTMKEKSLTGNLVVLLRNYAQTHQQLSSNSDVRKSLEALLPGAIAQFKGGIDANTINQPMSAFGADIGGRRPLNIFLDAQFENVLNALLNKYSEKIVSNDFAKDFAVGKEMYADLVMIASSFLDKVSELQDVYQKHVETVAPKMFTKKENERSVINMDIDKLNINLEEMDVKKMIQQKMLDGDFKIECAYAFCSAIKASNKGIDIDDGSGKKLRLPIRLSGGLVLDSLVKTYANDFDKSEFCKGVIARPDSNTKVPDLKSKFMSDYVKEATKDLNAYGAKLKFCSILGNKKSDENMGSLSMKISESMNDVINLVEEQFNNKDILTSLKNLFKSEVDKGLEHVASDIFRDQVVSTLLSKFYTTQTGDTIGKIEKGDKNVNISTTYTNVVPLLLAVEKLASNVMDSLKAGNAAFKKMMTWVSDNKTKLGFNDKDLVEAQKVIVADYKNQLSDTFRDVFEKFDLSCLKNVDFKDKPAFEAVVNKLGASMAKELVDAFKSKVTTIGNTVSNLADNANKDHKKIHEQVQTALACGAGDFFGKDHAEIKFHNQSKTNHVSYDANDLLFGDDGAVKTVFDNISNKKTAALYLKFANGCSKKNSPSVSQYAKSATEPLPNEKAEVIKSMKTYLENLTGGIFKKIQADFSTQIKNSGKYAPKDVERLAEMAAFRYIQEDGTKNTIGDYIKRNVKSAYLNCVNSKGELKLPKTDNISVEIPPVPKGFISGVIKEGEKFVADLKEGLKAKGSKAKDFDGNDLYSIDGDSPEKPFAKIIDKTANDGFFRVLQSGKWAAKKEGYEKTAEKYGFLQFLRFETDFYGSFINQQLEQADPLEVALMGKTPFCDKIVNDFKNEGYAENFKTYVDKCIDLFDSKDSDEFEYVKAYGFTDDVSNECRKNAIYQITTDKENVNCLSGKKFDVDDAKNCYKNEVFKQLQKKIDNIKGNAKLASKLFTEIEKYVQKRVDKLSNWWEETCLGVGKEPNAQEKLSSYLQKAVLKEFNAKFVTELLNQTWLQDGVQDKAIEALNNDRDVLGLGGMKEIREFVNEKNLAERIDKLNTVVMNLMEGVFSASSDNGLKQLINDAIAEQSKTNPAFATALDNYAKDNSQDAVSTLATNLEKLDFFKNMIKTEAGKYWNSCCKNGVFDKIKTEASINLKPIEQKTDAKVETEVEQKVENQAGQKQVVEGQKQVDNNSVGQPKVDEEQPVEEKSVEPEAFVIDFNKSDVNKAQTLKDVVINVLTGGAVAKEIHNVQDDDFKSAIGFLNDDAFLRDLYKSLLGTEFNDDVWNDVKETLKNNFIQKYYTNLMSGIDKAFNKDQKTISFAKTELNNEMFLNAYDDVLRARWQNRVTSAFGGMDKSVKQSMLVSLNHIINDKSADLMKPLPGDEQTVKGIIEKREERQMLLLSEIVTMLPLDSLFATEEAKREFINDDSSDVQINQLKMQKFLFDGIQAMLSGQSESNGVSKLTNSIDGVTPDRWGTFEQRLAFYKDFCVKSADRIETTRASFDNSFSETFVRGDGFKQLFLSDLFLEDDKIEKFEDFGLDKNDVMLASLNLHAEVMPKFGREMRNQQDSVDKLPYMQSYKAFTEDMIAVQEKVKNARKGSNIRKVALKLFGTQNTELTATKFTTRSESLSFGKTTMLGDLNGLLTNLQPLFNAAIQKEIDNRAAAQKALSEVVNNVDKRTEWRQTTRAAIAAEMKLDPQNPDAAGKIENELAKRELAMLKSYFEDDLGLTSAEVNGICKKVLDMVLNGASHKSNVQKPEIKDENPEIIKLFGEKKAKQVNVAIAALKNVTPPTETSKHRNSFSGFIQRYAILKEAINIADKGND